MADSNIRAIVVGDGGVGKSCFIISWTAGVFPSGYVPTVFDNRIGDVVVDDEFVGVLFWDTRESLHRSLHSQCDSEPWSIRRLSI